MELCKSNSFIKLTFSLRVVQDVWGISQNDWCLKSCGSNSHPWSVQH